MRRRITNALMATAFTAGIAVSQVAAAAPAFAAPAAGSASFGAAGQSQTFDGTAGARQVSNTCSTYDQDSCLYYSVTLSAPLTLTASLTGAAGSDFDLSLYSPASEAAVVTSGNPESNERIDATLGAGTYYVQVQPYSTRATDSFSLVLSAEGSAAPGTLLAPADGSLAQTTFTGPAPAGALVTGGCQGNADADCRLYEVTVPYAEAQLTVNDTAPIASAAEYVTTILTPDHRALGSETFIDGEDTVTVNLPGPGTYYLQLESTVAAPTDTYEIDVSVLRAVTPTDTGVVADPGPQPADAGLFTRTNAFATKTGFRGVFSWEASEIVRGVVHYGQSPGALTSTVQAVPGAPDTAGIAVADGLEVGKIYYWNVEDELTGATSVTKSFVAANAWTSWNGSTYTINLLTQLDSESLPPGIPADQAIEDIAQGMNVFAERVYDATDGLVRVGQTLVTDTNLDYAANVPFQSVPICAPGANLADVLVETTVPFDSHTYGGYMIDDPCTSFYVGRLGQLVTPWEDDLHFGYVSAHEMSHYAFSAPDLYSSEAGGQLPGGCKNFDWDGSLMHNTGGWNGSRWELTELDRNPTLTPCEHDDTGVAQPYTWDNLRARYLHVPLRPAGPIEHIIDTRARGNADGGAFRATLLNRAPAASTLSDFTPDDAGAECSVNTTSFDDPEGDATIVKLGEFGTPPLPLDDTDITSVSVHNAGGAIRLSVSVVDLPEQPLSAGDAILGYFTIGAGKYRLFADRDPNPAGAPPVTASVSKETGLDATGLATYGPSTSIPVVFDAAADTMAVDIPASVVGGAVEGLRISALEVLWRRSGGAVALPSDSAVAPCSLLVTADPDVTPVVPEMPGGPALPLAALVLCGGAAIVLRRRKVAGTVPTE